MGKKDTNGTITISGDTVQVSGKVAAVKTATGQDILAGKNVGFSISGGTFSSAIPEAYCADGFIPVNANEDGKYTVSNSVTLTLDKTTANITIGGTETLTATSTPSISDTEMAKITWSSSDTTVATVENGTVTGISAGTATITASIGNINATCTITVTSPNPTTYTITYTDGVDDAVIFEDQTSTVDAGTITPEFNGILSRDGYTFAGWSPEIAEAVTADVTYTAQWTPIGSHTVTYTDGIDDAVIFENQVYTVRNDTENIPSFEGEVPARANYNFTGWSEPVSDTNGNITITAQWLIKPITITYTDGITTSEIFADQVYNANPGEATPAFSGTPTRPSYNFTGWSPAVTDTVTVADSVTSITYTAQWSYISSGGSGGGGGGGSSTPSVTPNNPPTTNIGENDTPLAESPNGDLTLTVDGTAADNIAKAEVKPEDIDNIVTKATGSTKNVTVNVKADNSGNGAVIDIPAASVAALGEKTGAALIVNTDAGSITISNSALSGIGSDTGNITITVTKANDSDIDVTVAKDGVPINTIAGGIKAVIPVASAAPGTAV